MIVEKRIQAPKLRLTSWSIAHTGSQAGRRRHRCSTIAKVKTKSYRSLMMRKNRNFKREASILTKLSFQWCHWYHHRLRCLALIKEGRLQLWAKTSKDTSCRANWDAWSIKSLRLMDQLRKPQSVNLQKLKTKWLRYEAMLILQLARHLITMLSRKKRMLERTEKIWMCRVGAPWITSLQNRLKRSLSSLRIQRVVRNRSSWRNYWQLKQASKRLIASWMLLIENRCI